MGKQYNFDKNRIIINITQNSKKHILLFDEIFKNYIKYFVVHGRTVNQRPTFQCNGYNYYNDSPQCKFYKRKFVLPNYNNIIQHDKYKLIKNNIIKYIYLLYINDLPVELLYIIMHYFSIKSIY